MAGLRGMVARRISAGTECILYRFNRKQSNIVPMFHMTGEE